MSKDVEALIENEEVIAEANRGGYQPIRFTKIKYKKCQYAHIDKRWTPIFGPVRGVSKVESSGCLMPRGPAGSSLGSCPGMSRVRG